jgi:hypothetical protein
MTTVNFNFSIDEILKQIYALTAMHALTAEAEPVAMLTDDNRDALRMVIVDNFGFMALQLGSIVADCELPDDEPEYGQIEPIMSLTLRLPDRFKDGNTSPLLRAMESALAYSTLRDVYLDSDSRLSNLYANRAAMSVDNVKAMVDMPDSTLPGILGFF